MSLHTFCEIFLMTEENKYKLKSHINARRTLVSGTGWRGGAELFRVAWSSVVVLILASMLDPIVFGLVGMTDALVQFFNIFMTMGFDAAIIQQEDVNERILSSLFWLNLILGVVLAGVGVAIAPLLSWFYQESAIEPIFIALCTTFVLQSFSVVQRGLLGRELAFRTLAIIDVLASILSSVAAIIIAFRGGSYWSLVVLQLGKHAVMAIGYWLNSSWRPQLVIDMSAAMPSIRFSSNILLFNFLNFIASRSDIILVGRLLGAEQAGLYLLANRLIMNPVGQILKVIIRTMYPVLAAIQQNVTKVRETYVKAIVSIFLVIAPGVILAGILGPTLIPFYLGEEWIPLVPIFLVWCFGALRRIITSQMGVLYWTMNRPDLQWKYQLVSTPTVIIALVLGVQQGALGASISYNLAQFATSFLSFYFAFSLIDLGIGAYFSKFKYATLALAGEVFVGIILLRWLNTFSLHPLIISILIATCILPLYMAILYFLDPYTRQLWSDGRNWLANQSARLRHS